jgi:hypothetical protein
MPALAAEFSAAKALAACSCKKPGGRICGVCFVLAIVAMPSLSTSSFLSIFYFFLAARCSTQCRLAYRAERYIFCQILANF